MSDPASSSASRDPVAVALGWLIGQELGRAKRVRNDDLRAAGRALGLPDEDIPALERDLRDVALLACEDPAKLPLVEQAAVLVFFDARDVERRPGSEPPWELVSLTARRRIGDKRKRLIRAIPDFNASTGASLRDNFEQPLLNRLAGLVRIFFRDRLEPETTTTQRLRPRTPSIDLGSAHAAVGISARAAYEGLLLVATVARRNDGNSRWATAVVDEVKAHHPGLLSAKEAHSATLWLVSVGAADLRPHDWEPVTGALFATLRDGVLAPDIASTVRTGAMDGRTATLFRLMIATLVRQLGPETVHVLAAAGSPNRASPLGRLVEPEISKELRSVLRRERKLSRRGVASGLLHRPFLDLEGIASPATMLRPTYGVVPFDDAAGQLRRLVEWTTNETRAHSVVALLGPAGSGKTRLAVELCKTMSRQGWTTGMMTRSTIIDPAGFSALMSWNARRVLVVDYAEDRPDQVRTILTGVHGAGSATHPIRLILTVRRAFGAGWRSAFRGSDGDNLLDTADELDVIDAWQHVDRDHFFRSAQTAFAHHLQLVTAEPKNTPAWITSPNLDRPLLLSAAALTDLISAQGAAPPTRRDADDVITALLAHEANYWTGAPAHRNEPAGRAVTARALIAAALGQPSPDLTEADVAARLKYSSDLANESVATRRHWARWLLRQYPGGRLEPDLLLEQLVVEQCGHARPDDPIDWTGALAPNRSPADLAATLTLIARVAQHNPHFALTVTAAWSLTLGPLLEVARLSSDDDGQLLTSLAATAEALPVTPDIEDLALRLPDDQRLIAIGETLVRKTVAALQKRGTSDDRMFTALLALGVYSGMLSKHDEAIAATTQAVEWVRRTATDNEQRADLAVSLSNLGGDLAEAGEHAAANTAAQEAVIICRDLLNEGSPDAAIDLAAALQNLGGCLTTAGDHHGALAATFEAVSLIRDIASTKNHEQLSLALTNLALSFLHLHQAEQALDAADEAVTLWRPLAHTSSVEYAPQLLSALSTLATALTRNNKDEAALRTRRETVQLARRLYANEPQRWQNELRRQLKLLARNLANQGLTTEETKIRTEAETLTQTTAHPNT